MTSALLLLRLCLAATPPATTPATSPGSGRSRELYLGGFAGVSLPFESDVEQDDIPRLRRVVLEDARADGSALVGVSFGEWHINARSRFTWGFRADLARFRADTDAQAVHQGGSSDGTAVDGPVELAATESRVTSIHGSVLAGARFGGGREGHGYAFYLGGGGGVERWSLRAASGPDRSNAFVIHGIASGEHFFSRRVAAFAEIRYSSARHTFRSGTQESEVRRNLNQLALGCTYHF